MPATKYQYTKESLNKALEAVKSGNSVSSASKMYSIPRSTLRDKLSNRYDANSKAGAATILTETEEQYLVKWMDKLTLWGFPVTRYQLLDAVADLVKKLKRPNTFTAGRPGKKWYTLFMKRHPNIVQRVSQLLHTSRANLTEHNIRKWFSEIQDTLRNENHLEITLDASRTFNCDETAFFLAPKEKAVLVKKGLKQVYSKIANDEKECVTVLINICANGKIPPPMILFAYKRLPRNILKSIPEEWGFGISDSGWMTSETFFEYITNVFHPWLIKENVKLPVILYVDGHSSHINIHLSEFCEKNGIILIALFPNATHILQPCDVGLFHSLKNEWRTAVRQYRWQQNGKKLDKENFAPLLKSCLEKAGKENTIKNAFKTTGLFPFEVENINFKKLLKRIQPDVEKQSDLEKNPQPALLDGKTESCTFLKMFESRLSKNLLEQFQNNVGNWNGDVVDKSLYEFWLKSKEIEESEVQIIPQNQEILLDDSFWFGPDNMVDLIVNKDGSVVIDNSKQIINENVLNIPTLICSDLDENVEFEKPAKTQMTPLPETLITPLKEINPDENFPTPFKTSLFWPEPHKKDLKFKPKKKPRPSVATSKEFLNFLRKETQEKTEKEQQKIANRVKRKMKFDKTKNSSVSINKDNGEKKRQKLEQKIVPEKENQSINAGDYVIVNYEQELYPGLVLEKLNESADYKIKTMSMIGSNWRWPDMEDICVYPLIDIIKITPPGLINNRGIYSVPEIEQLKIDKQFSII